MGRIFTKFVELDKIMDKQPVDLFPSEQIQALTEKIGNSFPEMDRLRRELGKIIIGQHQMVDRMLIALLCNGHILLEGVPGLAKTLAVNTLATAMDVRFQRIQFTPDLLPADVTGTQLFNQKTGDFTIKKGPIFSNFILADEINRAPAKVQSALLEAMQERQITIGELTFKLDEPFLVLATMNPIDQEGTYSLPEAQVDRFMLKVVLDFPSFEEEQQILRVNTSTTGFPSVDKLFDGEKIIGLRNLVREIYLDEKLEKYIVQLVFATRTPEKYGMSHLLPFISHGCSPRATIHLAMAAKAKAFLSNRAFVLPEDIKDLAIDVMQHRVGLTYEAEAENKTSSEIIRQILHQIQVP